MKTAASSFNLYILKIYDFSSGKPSCFIKGLFLVLLVSLNCVQVASGRVQGGELRTDFEVVASSVDVSPLGSTFGVVASPVINNQGVVSFLGVNSERAIFTGTNQSDIAVVNTGANLGFVVVSDDTGRAGTDGNGGFSLSSAGSSFQFAADGGQVPGSNGENVAFIGLQAIDTDGRFRLSRDGSVGFVSRLSGFDVQSNNDFAIFGGAPENLQLIVREGDAVADVIGASFSLSSSFVDVSAGSGGTVAFTANLDGPGIDTTNRSAIFTGSAADGVRLLARQGDQPPGLPPGAIFGNQISEPRINGDGEVAFESNLFNTGGFVGSSPTGIFTGTPDNLELRFLSSDPLSGSPTGGVGNITDVVFNDEGDVAFRNIFPGVRFGLSSSNQGVLDLFAVQDEQVSAISGDVEFESLGDLAFNNRGVSAFIGNLAGTDVTNESNSGIFLHDHLGGLQLLLREGDLLEFAPGDFRTITSLSFNRAGQVGSDDGFARPLNDLGQVVFIAGFDDGTSAVVVSPVIGVPEPSGFAALGIGLFSLCLRRKREP